MEGTVFSRLTIVRYDRLEITESGKRYHRWICKCSCGNLTLKSVRMASLQRRRVQSCGCLHKEAVTRTARKMGLNNLTHGHATKGNWSPTYHSWAAMKRRCLNPNDKHYSYYGERGVTIDPRWVNSFENFLADMGERPEGKTLDRHPDPYGNYEPGNVKWSTKSEQQQNQRPRRRKKS